MSNDHSKKRHILIVADDPRILVEIKVELMNHFDISISATGEAAKAALEMYEVSAILIHVGESSEKSFSLVAGIFEPAKTKNIPILFLAEKGNDDDENAAFSIGVVDYSVRRSGTVSALINRINLRIYASENEKLPPQSEDASLPINEIPEAVFIGKTILIADDLEINREIIAGMLSHIEGLKLESAANGKEVVDKIIEKPNLYTLILMDIQMPVMNGLEAAKAIRNLDCENARKIPIIAMTAGTGEDEIAKCLEAGMNDFLEKPMTYERLLAVAAAHCS